MPFDEEQYQRELRRIEDKNNEIRLKKQLKDKREYMHRPPSMSKIILVSVALLCLEIVLFCELYIWTTGDGSAMYSLIGVPVALAPTVIAYYAKSAKENTAGGIVYDSAMTQEDEPVG